VAGCLHSRREVAWVQCYCSLLPQIYPVPEASRGGVSLPAARSQDGRPCCCYCYSGDHEHTYRPMVDAVIPQVTALLNTHFHSIKLLHHFSEGDLRHLLLPQADIVSSYFPDGSQEDSVPRFADFCSFHHLPYTVVKSPDPMQISCCWCKRKKQAGLTHRILCATHLFSAN